MKNLRRQIRLLQIYTGVLTTALVWMMLSGFENKRQKIRELDVERINVVESDGKLRMTISNKFRFPDPVIGGKTLAGARHGAKSAGLIFFNDNGDECGGLSFDGTGSGDNARAGGVLLFDQYNQDQTVGIMYSQAGDQNSAGFHVWDRPNTPLLGLYERSQEIQKMADGPEKKARMDQLAQEGASPRRVFLGRSQDGSAGITLADRHGKTRVVLTVDANNNPVLRFMDEGGQVTYSIPPDGRK